MSFEAQPVFVGLAAILLASCATSHRDSREAPMLIPSGETTPASASHIMLLPGLYADMSIDEVRAALDHSKIFYAVFHRQNDLMFPFPGPIDGVNHIEIDPYTHLGVKGKAMLYFTWGGLSEAVFETQSDTGYESRAKEYRKTLPELPTRPVLELLPLGKRTWFCWINPYLEESDRQGVPTRFHSHCPPIHGKSKQGTAGRGH